MDDTGARELIDAAYEDRDLLAQQKYADAVRSVVAALDAGELRVASKDSGEWVVNAWVKKAILLYFIIAEMRVMEVGPFEYFDKIPVKTNLKAQGVRVVPPGTIRCGGNARLCEYWRAGRRRYHGRYLGYGWFLCAGG